MQTPPKPADEHIRIDTLRALNILDTAPEERFDRLTRLARRLFGVPIALVSLVDADRQWFKSCFGLNATETPRDISFCSHAINGDDIFTIPDAMADARFQNNPFVTGAPNIRFYAGCPLTVANGSKLGTLCLLDVEPRELSDDDREMLRDLARMAEQELAAVQLATMDELTMLSNRRGFEALAQHALNVCHRVDRPATLLFMDMDGFKQINDRWGHAEGDRALVAFASILRETFRDSDVIGRLGGDEFVSLLTSCDEPQAMHFVDRLRARLETHNAAAARGYDIRVSVGATQAGPDTTTIGELVAAGDSRMYESKRAGRAGRLGADE